MMTRGRWHPVACLYPSMPNHGPPWASPPPPVHPRDHLTPSSCKTPNPPWSPKRRGSARGKHRRSGSHGHGGAGRAERSVSADADTGASLRKSTGGRRKGDGDKGIPAELARGVPEGRSDEPARRCKTAAKSNQTHPHGHTAGGQRARSGPLHGGCPHPNTTTHQPRARAWTGLPSRRASPKPYPYNIKPNPSPCLILSPPPSPSRRRRHRLDLFPPPKP